LVIPGEGRGPERNHAAPASWRPGPRPSPGITEGRACGALAVEGGHREDCFLVTPDLIRGPCFGRCYGSRIKSGMTKLWEARSVFDRNATSLFRHPELVSGSM